MNIGIIGCGKITQVRHVPEYMENPECSIMKVYDLNQKRAEEVAGMCGALACGSEEEIFKDPQIDAVSICVINTEHAKVAVRALEAGKHVLCEKPMGISLEECTRMAEAARENGRRLLIGQNQRLLHTHRQAKAMIEQGAIGRPLTFHTAFGHSGPDGWSVDRGSGTWFFDRNRSYYGVMGDLGVHKVDLIQFLLGKRAESVFAAFDTLDKTYQDGSRIDVEDNAVCILRMSGGITGTIKASWTYYGEEDNRTEIIGTEGNMTIFGPSGHSIVIARKDGTRIACDMDRIQTNSEQSRSGVISEFVEAVTTGRASCLDGVTILDSMKTVFACLDSAKSGQWVKPAT